MLRGGDVVSFSICLHFVVLKLLNVEDTVLLTHDVNDDEQVTFDNKLETENTELNSSV